MAGELIMVVEDDEIIALEIASIVSRWEFRTVTARTGAEALMLSDREPPVLALMDIKLKGPMDGIETAIQLRENHGTAIIFVSAYSETGTIDRAKQAMPFGYLVKPVQDQELRASIETALYMHRIDRERKRAEAELRAAHDMLEQRVEERTGELRRANKELAESEERYRALYENTRVGIGIATLDGDILDCNPALTAILGYSLDEMKALKTKDLYADPEDRERVLAQLHDTGYLRDFETVLVGKNGVLIDMNLNSTSYVWKDQVILYTMMEDITERKQALDAIILAHAELERRVEERTAELAAANRKLENEIAERVQAEKSLRKSEARFRAVVENSYDGIIFTDAHAKVLYRSPSYTAINGYTDEDRIGQVAFEMVHPDYQDEVWRTWKEVIKHPEIVFKMELQIRHKDGAWRWIDSTAKNMLANPDVRAVVIVSRDVTGRKKNELDLREMNERLELTMNASGAGSWDWDIPTGMLVWSSKMFEIFGLDESVTEASFDVWRSTVHPEDLEAAEAKISRTLEERKDLYNEYRVILPGGVVRWIIALGRGVYDEHGAAVRMGGICIDITKRKQMEDRLKLSEEKFSKAFMATPEAVTIQTIDEGIFIDVNESFLTVSGFDRDEVVGRSSIDVDVWIDTRERDRYIKELITRGRVRNFEARYRMKKGEIRDCIVSSEIIQILTKRCSLNFILDITERKRAEAVLKQEHENFLKIFSMAPVGLLLLDADLVITQANTTAGAIVLRDPAEIIGRRAGGGIGCIHSQEDPRGCGYSTSCPQCPLRHSIESVLAGGVPVTNREVEADLLINGALQKRWLSINAELVAIEGRDNIILAVGDITDLKIAEETTTIERELLRRCNRAESVKELIQGLTLYLKNIVGCEAVGVRLRDGEDFPYYETKGFAEEFVLAENSLCARDLDGRARRDESGNPVLDCMCGNIICGRFDPSKPFFTPGGSFWSSCTTELLATTTEEDRQARTRNRCNGEGYESVALIPIRVKDTVLGLFQFNDRRKGLYTAEKIAWLERLVDFIAISMAKLMADDDLRRQKEILQTILDNIPVMIAYFNERGEFIWMNQYFTKTLGWSYGEMKKNNLLELCYPDHEYRSGVMQFMLNGKGTWGEFMTRTKYDTVLYTAWANVALTNGSFIGIGQDITERKLAEESRSRLIRNLEALWGLSKQQDRDLQILADYILEEMMKLTGSAFAFYGFINDDESEMSVYSWSRAAMARCAMGNKPLVFNIAESGIWAEAVRGRRAVVINDYRVDFAGKRGLPEGHVPLTRLASVPVFRSGRIVALGAVANKESEYSGEDIKTIAEFLTNANIIIERKRAEYLVRLSEERYRTVADFTFDWEFWFGSDGGILYMSPSCERITGYAPAEFIANPDLMLSVVHPEDADRVRDHFANPGDISCETQGFDFRIVRRDGAVRWIGHRCQMVYGREGRALGRRGSHRDITDRKNAEEEILRLNRHIITLQEQERQRVAKDLHDGVSQMMNAAKLNFAAFNQDPEKNMDRFDTAMEFIDLASRELREVYSNLYPAVLEDLGLAAAVRLYTKNFLANRGIDADVTIDEELQLSIEVQMDLYRIIQESCSNIARHSGAGRARVDLRRRDGAFVLEIADDGSGFEPGAPRSAEGGFGIINMKQRVKHLNGSFELDTGRSGTRISITIPAEGGHG
ncbi:MAG: PAS domain S-box protein [Spirochaetes bacterium]|nr:PAS domain S-box protein [Spirochaetota bacterium]